MNHGEKGISCFKAIPLALTEKALQRQDAPCVPPKRRAASREKLCSSAQVSLWHRWQELPIVTHPPPPQRPEMDQLFIPKQTEKYTGSIFFFFFHFPFTFHVWQPGFKTELHPMHHTNKRSAQVLAERGTGFGEERAFVPLVCPLSRSLQLAVSCSWRGPALMLKAEPLGLWGTLYPKISVVCGGG